MKSLIIMAIISSTAHAGCIKANITGMVCGGCEAKVTEAVKKNFPKAQNIKVSSSEGKLAAEFLQDPNMGDFRKTLLSTGYNVSSLIYDSKAKACIL
jgi:copper chaperone CopZ